MDELILAQWAKRVVGRTEVFCLGPMEPLWTQRYAMAVNDLNPVYFDDQLARDIGLKGMVVPPNYLATLRSAPRAGPAEDDLLEDGTPEDGRPELPGLQIMGGGQHLQWLEHVYCGEIIWGEKTIKSIDTREGKSGPMVIVQEEIIYRTDAAVTKLILTNKSLYRVVNDV